MSADKPDRKEEEELGGRGLAERVVCLLDTMVDLLFMLRMGSRWATYTEAERYAHIAHGVISDAVDRGEIAAYRRKGGRRVLVHLDDVDLWIRTCWVCTHPEASGR